MTYLQRFVDEYFKRDLAPSVERNPAGDKWTVRIPVPIFATFTVTEREVMSWRLDMRGFLRELVARGEAAREAAIAQYEDGAKR